MKTLANFQPLKPAEEKLLECCQSEDIATIVEKRPTKKTKANEIRAEFLRWLVLTKEIEIDPNGIRFEGAWVTGVLNLENCHCSNVLDFTNSVFEKILLLKRTTIKSIYADGSLFKKGIEADGLICHGNLHLRNGFEAEEEVRFLGAEIKGNFDCNEASFKAYNEEQKALHCDKIHVHGTIFLSKSIAEGEVRFLGAKVEGNFTCTQASFKAFNKEQKALSCDGINVYGEVSLRSSNSEGEVRFLGAEIKGSFNCIQATFKAFNEKQKALSCDGINIFGVLFLRQNCKILKGIFDLTNAIVNSLVDDESFWNQKSLIIANLDGFKYMHIHGTTSAFFRLKNMLAKMPKFKPQPYKQLAKVLREMGHDRDADEVMIALHDKKLELSKESWRYKAFRKLYKGTSAYGYRPMRTLKIMASVWFLFGCVYWYGANVAVFAPTNPLIFQKDYNCTIDKNGTKWLAFPKDYNESNNWYIASPAEYTTFQPFWYSLDIILPVVDLKMENDWGIVIPSPEGNWTDMIPFTTTNHFIRFLTWIETLTGWGLSLMLVAILSGLAKNEKE